MDEPKRFRVLVTGSRTWTDHSAIQYALAPFRSRDAVLVHGNARGADRIAAGIWHAWGEHDEPHPADWEREGRAAGLRRNQRMVDAGADVCLAFIQDNSCGASHTADRAQAAGIPTMRHRRTTITRAPIQRER
ncbi:DUF2493 domain-containing protein [Nocardia brasiliensis]|uniref:DUF2493 domain-containing protein n=1 Tax=Nocardia brasiliensis TaxID=37326 RepID=A0A6G9XN57_NOCBR|nr:SLOG family protein [Nocardia brasiliensis]QIS02344.1 DUF2493 domain-containing protein [Nocardia brasiliensis]